MITAHLYAKTPKIRIKWILLKFNNTNVNPLSYKQLLALEKSFMFHGSAKLFIYWANGKTTLGSVI